MHALARPTALPLAGAGRVRGRRCASSARSRLGRFSPRIPRPPTRSQSRRDKPSQRALGVLLGKESIPFSPWPEETGWGRGTTSVRGTLSGAWSRRLTGIVDDGASDRQGDSLSVAGLRVALCGVPATRRTGRRAVRRPRGPINAIGDYSLVTGRAK